MKPISDSGMERVKIQSGFLDACAYFEGRHAASLAGAVGIMEEFRWSRPVTVIATIWILSRDKAPRYYCSRACMWDYRPRSFTIRTESWIVLDNHICIIGIKKEGFLTEIMLGHSRRLVESRSKCRERGMNSRWAKYMNVFDAVWCRRCQCPSQPRVVQLKLQTDFKFIWWKCEFPCVCSCHVVRPAAQSKRKFDVVKLIIHCVLIHADIVINEMADMLSIDCNAEFVIFSQTLS